MRVRMSNHELMPPQHPQQGRNLFCIRSHGAIFALLWWIRPGSSCDKRINSDAEPKIRNRLMIILTNLPDQNPRTKRVTQSQCKRVYFLFKKSNQIKLTTCSSKWDTCKLYKHFIFYFIIILLLNNFNILFKILLLYLL